MSDSSWGSHRTNDEAGNFYTTHVLENAENCANCFTYALFDVILRPTCGADFIKRSIFLLRES